MSEPALTTDTTHLCDQSFEDLFSMCAVPLSHSVLSHPIDSHIPNGFLYVYVCKNKAMFIIIIFFNHYHSVTLEFGRYLTTKYSPLIAVTVLDINIHHKQN